MMGKTIISKFAQSFLLASPDCLISLSEYNIFLSFGLEHLKICIKSNDIHPTIKFTMNQTKTENGITVVSFEATKMFFQYKWGRI